MQIAFKDVVEAVLTPENRGSFFASLRANAEKGCVLVECTPDHWDWVFEVEDLAVDLIPELCWEAQEA